MRNPPPGVLFSLQDKNNVLYQITESTGADIVFELEMERDAAGRAKGKFAMGPPAQRFLYVNSGTAAGQFGTPWRRRAKIPLTELPDAPAAEVTIEATAKDGGPVCASVRLPGDGWVPRRS